jgi:hypothetical protein
VLFVICTDLIPKTQDKKEKFRKNLARVEVFESFFRVNMVYTAHRTGYIKQDSAILDVC